MFLPALVALKSTGPGLGSAIPWGCRAAGRPPLADGSDFVAAYCEIPYTEVALSEDGMTLTVTMHDTFLSSGTLSKDVDLDFLKEYGSLYPESFPAGELAGSCTLIENADLRQDGNNAVLTVTLADGPMHGETVFPASPRRPAIPASPTLAPTSG